MISSLPGIEIHVAGETTRKIVKAKLLCVVMDLPAKANILNCNQYNGSYGCSTCKHPGKTVSMVIILQNIK